MNVDTWQIMVVEDEFDSMQMVSEILQFHGAQVIVARNGKECMDLLRNNPVSLVLTDLAMPDMDGWQVLNAIRSNPLTEKIPVVAVTAYHSVDVAAQALAAGFDAFYPKPVSARTFVNSLAPLIGE